MRASQFVKQHVVEFIPCFQSTTIGIHSRVKTAAHNDSTRLTTLKSEIAVPFEI